MIIAAIDSGKYATKAIGRHISSAKDEEIYFRNKLYNLRDGDLELQGNSFKVEFENEKYIIGEQGEHNDVNISKSTRLHIISIYTSLALIAKNDRNPSVILTIGCPTTIYMNKKLKEEFRELIKEKPRIIVNEVEYNFNFRKIIIKCEGSGIVYLEPKIFKNERVAVIDIGGRNVNFGVYDNRIPVPSTLFSNNYGSTYLETLVKESMNTSLGIDCDLIVAKETIKRGGIMRNGIIDKDSQEIINNVISKYIKAYILKTMVEKNIHLELMPVIMIGGTSFFLFNQMKKEIPHLIKPTLNPQWSNVRGFYIVCKIKAELL